MRGKITSVNDKFCETTQYTRDEVIGRNHRIVNSGYHPREFWQAMWTTIKAGRIWKGEIRNTTKNGAFYWVECTIIPVRDETGTINGFVSVRTDITERRRSAEMLELAAREAEARNQELARAHAEALAATKAKSVFLASISHEMRTPLNAIVAMTDLLAESQLQSHQEDYVRRLGRASGSLLQLVNDVLDLTKIEADQLVIESVPFDLYALLDDVSEMLALRVQEKQLGFVSFIEPSVPHMVVGDQTRLRQVLLNLAGNAVKFTRHGEVTIRVEPVLDSSGAQRMRFAVSDTGIGIPADKLTRVFESFTQVDASTTRKYGGTGLGLSISRRLVELMGGTLGVVSAPACGSTFSFDLALPASHQAAPLLPPIVESMRGRRVLVVDQHETNRLAAQTLLAQAGVVPVGATDAAGALAALASALRAGDLPVLALIEEALPFMSGVALAGAIRARAEFAALPIVMYSGDPKLAFDPALRELGISDCFTRPFTRRRVLSAMARAVGNARTLVNEPADAPPAPPVDLQPAAVRVLVVEDAEDNREVIAMFLRGGRYQLDLAENGAVGVERFLEGQYDVVLMDMQMPIMDGYQATAAIRHWEREQGRTPVPIVAITANAFPEDVERALNAGCTLHLAKPIRKSELLRVLAEHVQSPSSDQAA
ncbi:MAG: response regulator [Vicinamibacterales bacterium]